ncbi:MAG TPA: hypothetical protein VHW73_14600 [Rudaea sp.]|nr:hypothetical protein [Rudaea sp.]
MHPKLALVCLSIAAANAMAAEANNPPSSPSSAQSTASDKSIAPRRIIAPTISETRATRMPDGSLAVTCIERPNPKARTHLQKTPSPQLDPGQTP